MGQTVSALEKLQQIAEGVTDAILSKSFLGRIVTGLMAPGTCKQVKDANQIEEYMRCQVSRASREHSEIILTLLVTLLFSSIILLILFIKWLSNLTKSVHASAENKIINLQTVRGSNNLHQSGQSLPLGWPQQSQFNWSQLPNFGWPQTGLNSPSSFVALPMLAYPQELRLPVSSIRRQREEAEECRCGTNQASKSNTETAGVESPKW